jgi:hypothetical protein
MLGPLETANQNQFYCFAVLPIIENSTYYSYEYIIIFSHTKSACNHSFAAQFTAYPKLVKL